LASLERGRIPSPRPIAAREIPLIDRVEEIKLLKEAADRTIQGEGGLVLLYGEAGIGKTRLARELRAYAHLRGMQVLYGRCPALFRMDGVPPYVLWSQVIRDYLENSTPEQLYRVVGFYPAEVAKLVPELGQKLRTIPQSFPISPEQEQNRLFEAVSQFITNISREAPLLVVLDDLQWTDPSSLLLLHYMARGVQKTPLLLLGAYRSTDIDAKHPLSPVLTELNRERLPQSIQLKRMSLNDVSEMIKSILEQDDVPAEFCKLVYEKTRGNPFFAEEVVRSLKEEEVIYREENKWKIKEVSKIEFPETVKSVIKARLDRLDEESQSVLTFASFVGNDFTLDAMCALTGIEENKLLELMDKMLKTGFIKEREIHGEGICSFADILVRDVVYEEVSLLKRKKLHGVVGVALEKVYAKKIDEHFGELASHFLEGGEKDKALDYFFKAGEKAARIYANVEATSYFQSALRLLEEKEGEFREKGRVLEKLGDIKKLVGEYDSCLKYWNDGLLMWGQLDEKVDISRFHRKIANVLWEDTGDVEEAKVHHDKALKILETEPESVELASLYEDMARMYGRTESMTLALNWAEKALELAKKLNDQGVIASSYVSLGAFTLFTSGDWKKAVECHEKALKIALDNGLMETAIQAYNSLGTALPWQEQERCVDCFEKGFELAKKVGAIRWVSLLGTTLAGLYGQMGITDKAVLLAEESVVLDRKTGNMFNLSLSLNTLGFVYLVLGEWDKSEKYLTEALNLSKRLDQYGRIAWSSIDLSNLYGLCQGDFPKARKLLEEAIGILEKAGAKLSQMIASSYLVWTYIELGMLQEANNLLNVVHKFFLEMNDEGFIAWAETLRGMELRAQKKWEESIEHFEKSRRIFEQINARRWMTWGFTKGFLCEYARVYLERDQEGDRERAHNLLGQALEIFHKISAKKEIEKTIKSIEVLQPPHTQIREETVSSESLKSADVQSNIIASPRELKIGESLELEIEITNVSKKEAILLTKITEVIPEGFAIAKKPELYRIEGNCLNMKEKRLGPQETEEVKFVLTPKVQGTFHIKPRIIYIDTNGKEKTHEPKPTSITVKELGIKGWLKGER
jgi:tetratricopeptide (TPR) repeat protein